MGAAALDEGAGAGAGAVTVLVPDPALVAVMSAVLPVSLTGASGVGTGAAGSARADVVVGEGEGAVVPVPPAAAPVAAAGDAPAPPPPPQAARLPITAAPQKRRVTFRHRSTLLINCTSSSTKGRIVSRGWGFTTVMECKPCRRRITSLRRPGCQPPCSQRWRTRSAHLPSTKPCRADGARRSWKQARLTSDLYPLEMR